MKNRILAALTAAGIGAASINTSAQELESSINIGFESEYVFRGVELAGNSIQASYNGSYGDGYFGVWLNEPTDSAFESEIDFYGGFNYAIDATFIADFGITLYHYPDAVGDSETTEIYTGLSMDRILTPSLYLYYDFDLEALTVEGSLSHSIELDEKSSIDFAATGGYVDEPAGDKYLYYNLTADYVYTLTDYLAASAGVRAGGNDDHRGPGGKEHNLWGGLILSGSF